MAVLSARKQKADMEMLRERQRLSQVKVLSPMSGLVAIRQNRQSGFVMSGMQIPDVREGDQVQLGMPIADILDLSELEVMAKIGELDRASLKEGQEVLIRLDAGGGRRGMMFGGPGGAGGGGGGFGGLSEEDRTKMRAAMQKALNGRSMQELS